MKAEDAGVQRLNDVSLRQILEEAVDMFRDLMMIKGVSLKEIPRDGDSSIWGNRFELEQVFKNLVLNAIQAMENSRQKYLRISSLIQNAGGIKNDHRAHRGHRPRNLARRPGTHFRTAFHHQEWTATASVFRSSNSF